MYAGPRDSRSGGFRSVAVFSFDFEDCDVVKEYRMVRSRSLMFCTVPQRLGDLSSILYIGLARLWRTSSYNYVVQREFANNLSFKLAI